MAYEFASYPIIRINENPSYVLLADRAVVAALFKGDTAPMIAAINERQITDLSINLMTTTNSQGNDQVINQYLDSLGEVIVNSPSLTNLSIHANINSIQAATLAKQFAQTNISEFSINSELGGEGMKELMNALAQSSVEYIEFQGYLSDDAILNMQFKGNIEQISLFDVKASDAGIVQLFQNLYGTNVKTLELLRHDMFTENMANQIDLSQTNLERLNMFGFPFEEYAISKLSLAGSRITDLEIESSNAFAEHLIGLSRNLVDSKVESLALRYDNFQPGDLEKLDLRNTSVKELKFYSLDGFGEELAHLHLQGTLVKTLDFQAPFTDTSFAFLDLNNTQVANFLPKVTPIVFSDVIEGDSHYFAGETVNAVHNNDQMMIQPVFRVEELHVVETVAGFI